MAFLKFVNIKRIYIRIYFAGISAIDVRKSGLTLMRIAPFPDQG